MNTVDKMDGAHLVLSNAINQVEKNSYLMKDSIEKDELKNALKYAAIMLEQLKAESLSPKLYYELYIMITDELRLFEEYLVVLLQRGYKISKIYEQVQYTESIIPRLYLTCIVGSIYILSSETSTIIILDDLFDMIKGIQSPLRGLFIRHFLVSIIKAKLPDQNSIDTTIEYSYNYLINNFKVMNTLWIRIATTTSYNNTSSSTYTSTMSEKKVRDYYRTDLKVLIGINLERLSQLEGLNIYDYTHIILPQLLQEVVQCKDTLSQQYIIECILAVFPAEYHYYTLSVLLQACRQLKSKVNMRIIVDLLITRISQYMQSIANTSTTSVTVVYDKIDTSSSSSSDAVVAITEDNKDDLTTIPLSTPTTEQAPEQQQSPYTLLFDFISGQVNRSHPSHTATHTATHTTGGAVGGVGDLTSSSSTIQQPLSLSMLLLEDKLHMINALLTFSLTYYPTQLNHITQCIQVIYTYLNTINYENSLKSTAFDTINNELIEQPIFLSSPQHILHILNEYHTADPITTLLTNIFYNIITYNTYTLLSTPELVSAMRRFIHYGSWRRLAVRLVQWAIKNKIVIGSVEQVCSVYTVYYNMFLILVCYVYIIMCICK